jgi:pimeloyl-ACP methyl ester carboxylesterase
MRDDEYLSMAKSTIVRSRTGPHAAACVAGRALSTVAPALAARFAARLFVRPPRHRRPEAEARALAAARAGVLDVKGRRVRTWSWGDGRSVLLVHGWGGRGSQLAPFVEPLLARGFSVTTFDALGHGDSDGREATIPDLVASLGAVAAAHAPIHGVIAHSVGAVATARALYEDLRAGAVVFMGPPADLVIASFPFADALGLTRGVRELMQRRIEARAGLPWEAFDVTRLAECQTTPLLVIHDRGDAEVPWQQGAAIARAWPGARLLATDGLGHRRILRDPTAMTAAVSFVAATAGSRAPWQATDDDWQPDQIGERAAAGIFG